MCVRTRVCFSLVSLSGLRFLEDQPFISLCFARQQPFGVVCARARVLGKVGSVRGTVRGTERGDAESGVWTPTGSAALIHL